MRLDLSDAMLLAGYLAIMLAAWLSWGVVALLLGGGVLVALGLLTGVGKR